jgi:hypothetical protein
MAPPFTKAAVDRAPPDIDRILEAIRAEARARGSRDARIGTYSSGDGVVVAGTHGLPFLTPQHASDFLALPLDVFIGSAYRLLLGREPDAAGAAHYQRMLLRGSLTRIEMLGRLSFSAEARSRRGAVKGIAPAFLLALLYRIPIAGPLAAILARAFKLPPHWQDRSAIEAAALASGSWMKR